MQPPPKRAAFGRAQRRPPHEARAAPPSLLAGPPHLLRPGGFQRPRSPRWTAPPAREEENYEPEEPCWPRDPYARRPRYEHEDYGDREGQYDTEELYPGRRGYRAEGREQGGAYGTEPSVREPADGFPDPDNAWTERRRVAPTDERGYDDPYERDGYPGDPGPPRPYGRGGHGRPPAEDWERRSRLRPDLPEADEEEEDDGELAADLLVNFGRYAGPRRRLTGGPHRERRLAALLTGLGLTLDDLQQLGTYGEQEELTPGRSLDILRDVSERKMMNVARAVMGSGEAAAAVSAAAARGKTAIAEGNRPKVWDYTHGARDTRSGCPPPWQKNDYFGRQPPKFPHVCSICNKPVSGIRDWTKHVGGRIHQVSCEVFREKYPSWKPENWFEKSKSSKQNKNGDKEKTTSGGDPARDPAINTAVVEMELDSDTEEDKSAVAGAAVSAGAVVSAGAGNSAGAGVSGGVGNSAGAGVSTGAGKFCRSGGSGMSTGAGVFDGTAVSGGAGISDRAGMSDGSGASRAANISGGSALFDKAGMSGESGGAEMSRGSGLFGRARISSGPGTSRAAGMSGGMEVSDGAGVSAGAGMFGGSRGSGMSRVADISGGAALSGRGGVFGGSGLSGTAGVSRGPNGSSRPGFYPGRDNMPYRDTMHGAAANVPDRAGVSGGAGIHGDAGVYDRRRTPGGTSLSERFGAYASARLGGDTSCVAAPPPGGARAGDGAGTYARSGAYGGSGTRRGVSSAGTDVPGETGQAGAGGGGGLYGGDSDAPAGGHPYGGVDAYRGDAAPYRSDAGGYGDEAGGYGGDRGYGGAGPARDADTYGDGDGDGFGGGAGTFPESESYGGVAEYNRTGGYGCASGGGGAGTYGVGAYRRVGEGDAYGGGGARGGSVYLGERVSLSSSGTAWSSEGARAARLKYGSGGLSAASVSGGVSGLASASGPTGASGGNRFSGATGTLGSTGSSRGDARFPPASRDAAGGPAAAAWATEQRDDGGGGTGAGSATGPGYERWCFSPLRQSHRTALLPSPEQHSKEAEGRRRRHSESEEHHWRDGDEAESGERAPLGPYRGAVHARCWQDGQPGGGGGGGGGGWQAGTR